jgi:hypothetical protein
VAVNPPRRFKMKGSVVRTTQPNGIDMYFHAEDGFALEAMNVATGSVWVVDKTLAHVFSNLAEAQALAKFTEAEQKRRIELGKPASSNVVVELA